LKLHRVVGGLLPKPNSELPAILPDELIVEIISWLPVKTLMKFKCVNKFLKTTISDPHFVQMQLNKSSRNLHVAQWRSDLLKDQDASFVTLSIPDLLQKKITILHNRPLHRSLNCGEAVGSCNGLICFICYSYHYNSDWLCFWNPATRTLSKRFNSFTNPSHYRFKYSFGYL
jgi:hypothetical protein